MISSVFTLKETNNTPFNLFSDMETRLEENYYVKNSLNFLLECHDELLSYKKDYYKSIVEASYEDNPYIVNESFNTVINKVKQIIKKIIAYIESLAQRFITHIAKFVGSDKYIIKKKHEIKKFPAGKSFDIVGYEFTMDENVPVTDPISLNDIDNIKNDIKDITPENVSDKILAISSYTEKLTSVRTLDETRGQILNLDNPVTESSYNNEIFSIFRDGKSEASNITIRKEDVNKANNNYENYKYRIDEVKKLKKKITDKYKLMQSNFNFMALSDMKIDGESIINIHIDNNSFSTDYKAKLKYALDSLINAIIEYIQKVAGMHLLAFSGKLDAYNALVMQERNILYKALNMVEKDIDNTHIMREEFDTDYIMEASYRNYIYEKYHMNKMHKHFVNECICLTESRISDIKLINEDVKSDIKEKFNKIIEMVKSLFEKFLMTINSLITSNDTFLKKYKDVILTKKIESEPITDMPDYEAGYAKIKERKLKSLIVKDLIDLSEEQIQEKILPEYNSKEGTFSEFAKRFFLCANKPNQAEVPYNTLKLNEIYSFCLNAKSSIEVMKADYKVFKNEAEKIKTEVLKNVSESSEITNEFGEKYMYSTVLEGYINEADKTPSSTENKPSDSPGIPKASETKTDANKDTSIDTKLDRNTDVDKHKDMKNDIKSDKDGEDAKKQAEENKDKEYAKLKTAADLYLKVLRDFHLAKLSSFQKMYKEYMKILRYHVRKATGSMGSTNDFDTDDIKNLKAAMKDYKTASDKKDDTAKKKAEDRIIGIYKSRSMTIDAGDVAALVNKNASKL